MVVNVLEWERRFTLGLNTTSNTDCKQKLFRIKLPTKNSVFDLTKMFLDEYKGDLQQQRWDDAICTIEFVGKVSKRNNKKDNSNLFHIKLRFF